LHEALGVLREVGGRAVLGLRDILDEPAVVAAEWEAYDLANKVAQNYDRVLVYGHPAVLDPVRAYGFPAAVAARTHFCGYVCSPASRSAQPFSLVDVDGERPVVLATAGGGEDGFRLLRVFLDAAKGAHWRGVAVAGPYAGSFEQKALRRAAARTDAVFRRFVAGLPGCFGTVQALVAMGGYNTLTEAAASGTPTVCVPRVSPRKEQLIRAQAFERLGLVSLVAPETLTAPRLRAAIDAALAVPRPALLERAHTHLNFGGAQRAGRSLLALADRSGVTAAA
jgi:predicted glycosyltransferase